MAVDQKNINKWEAVFFALLFCFSVWIMFRTFSYDYENSKILIASHMWSDFAATLPLMRSFSLGDNWPPEYPIFPGSPIRYHYLFFLIVGKLEAIGIPLHWALNVPSTLGLFLLLAMIYQLGKKWFGDARIGVLAIAFFLLNGSLGFVQFFQKTPISPNTVIDVLTNSSFSAMGPWDGGNVFGVWHLLVYISQRHFGFSLGILFSFVYVCHCLEGKSRRVQLYWALFFGIVIGLFPVLHKAVLPIFAVFMSVYFLLLPFSRLFLFVTGAVSILVMGVTWFLDFNPFGAPSGFTWYPGVLVQGPLGFSSTVKFFWYQFGLHAVLIPIGYCMVPKRVKIFLLPAFIVAIAAFLFRFSEREAIAGLKFFNFFMIMAPMLSAYVVVKIYDFVSGLKIQRARALSLGVTAPIVIFLTLSGVIDFFPIVNMKMHQVPDVGANSEVKWFAESTPRDAVVASSQFLYSPASIAGRKIFLGYGYFTDSAGYDTRGRRKILDAIYHGGEPEETCRLLRENNISYVDVEDFEPNKGRPVVDVEYFRANFSPAYVSKNGRYEVYATGEMCE